MSVDMTEKMRVGVSIVKQLSTAFYSRKSMVLEELIANSYDAGATKVDLKLSPNQISVTDDGSGMSPEELTRFFYISYTEKSKKQVKEIRDKLKRYIIGKFGIGKLSMYQLCKRFQITTWKDGIESHSVFDFDEFEKREFIDEIELKVETRKVDPKKHGAELVLERLRPGTELVPVKVRRNLGKRLFLNPDFGIFVNGVKVATAVDAEYLSKHHVQKDLPKVGHVEGEIRFLKNVMASDNVGIYIRVKGRVINHDPRIFDFSQLSSAMFTSRRVWGIIDANGLEDAVQSNRSDFIKDNPKYEIFLEWITDELKKISGVFSKTTYQEIRTEEEKKSVHDFNLRMHSKSEKNTVGVRSKSQNGNKFDTDDLPINYEFKISTLGENGPEAHYDRKKNVVSVNTDHPLYKQARKKKCLGYHIMISSIIVVAAESSTSLSDFLNRYEKMIRAGEIPDFKKNRSK